MREQQFTGTTAAACWNGRSVGVCPARPPARFVIYQRRLFQSVGYISSYIMGKGRDLSLYCNVVAEQNYEMPQDRLWP